jgi:hypothetical protein
MQSRKSSFREFSRGIEGKGGSELKDFPYKKDDKVILVHGGRPVITFDDGTATHHNAMADVGKSFHVSKVQKNSIFAYKSEWNGLTKHRFIPHPETLQNRRDELISQMGHPKYVQVWNHVENVLKEKGWEHHMENLQGHLVTSEAFGGKPMKKSNLRLGMRITCPTCAQPVGPATIKEFRWKVGKPKVVENRAAIVVSEDGVPFNEGKHVIDLQWIDHIKPLAEEEEKKKMIGTYKVELEVYWTRKGDRTPNRRYGYLSATWPLANDTDPVVTSMACLPGLQKTNQKFQVDLKGEYEGFSVDTQMRAIAQLHKQQAAAIRRVKLAEKKKVDEYIARAEELVALKLPKVEDNFPEEATRLIRSYFTSRTVEEDGVIVDWEKEPICIDYAGWSLSSDHKEELETLGKPELIVQLEEKAKEVTENFREYQIAAAKKKHDREVESEKQEKQRIKTMKAWAAKNGTTRLKKQLQQGYEGRDLYLQERMQKEIAPSACIFSCSSSTAAQVDNPDMNQLHAAEKIAEHAVKMKLFDTMKDAYEAISIIKISGCDKEQVAVLVESYIPGTGFEPYQVKVVISSEEVSTDDKEKFDAYFEDDEEV